MRAALPGGLLPVLTRFSGVVPGVKQGGGQPARGCAVGWGLCGEKRGLVTILVQGVHPGNRDPFPAGFTLAFCRRDLAICCFTVVPGCHRAAPAVCSRVPASLGTFEDAFPSPAIPWAGLAASLLGCLLLAPRAPSREAGQNLAPSLLPPSADGPPQFDLPTLTGPVVVFLQR